MSQGLLCDVLVFLTGLLQQLIDAIFPFGPMIDTSPLQVTDFIGSIFGCNL